MKYMLPILVFILVSCDGNVGVEFIIHNQSTVTIDSVRVTTSDKRSSIRITDIRQGLDKKGFLDMRDILKVDGDYHVGINTPGVTKVNSIGYYTNGFPLDDEIHIYYYDDSIKLDFKK